MQAILIKKIIKEIVIQISYSEEINKNLLNGPQEQDNPTDTTNLVYG